MVTLAQLLLVLDPIRDRAGFAEIDLIAVRYDDDDGSGQLHVA